MTNRANEKMSFAETVRIRLEEAGLGHAEFLSDSSELMSFGNSAALFRIDGLLLRFVRDRGEGFLDIAPEISPTKFYQFDDVEIATGWRTIEQVLAKREPEDLGSVLARLRVELPELRGALSGNRLVLTRARIERAARERGAVLSAQLQRNK